MTDRPSFLTVSRMARKTGVSIRTLHHYDEIGLLTAERSVSGYRLYGPDHVVRLQEILLGRAIGLSLDDIRAALDDPGHDRVANLREHRSKLEARLDETRAMIEGIDETRSALRAGKENIMASEKTFKGFDPTSYEVEAKARWGETNAWKESARRKSHYSKADWAAIQAESDRMYEDVARFAAEGLDPESETGAGMVDRHRAHIEKWFYPLNPAMHCSLADMWQADQRFRDTMDGFGEGVTDWLATAVRAAYR